MTSSPDNTQSRYTYAAAVMRDAPRRAAIADALVALDQAAEPRLAVIAGAREVVNARRVGILAGSFNPPTLAHLQLATGARAIARLDTVIWTISRVTVDKETVTRAPLPDRLLTLAALIAMRPHEAVGVLNRGLYVAQIAAIRATLPQVQEIVFVIGFDKIVQIVDPRYYADRDAALDELFAQAQVLVAPRNDDTEADLVALFARPENRRWASRVQYLPLDSDLRDISSSHIRARINAGTSVAGLVPPEACALIDSGAYAGE